MNRCALALHVRGAAYHSHRDPRERERSRLRDPGTNATPEPGTITAIRLPDCPRPETSHDCPKERAPGSTPQRNPQLKARPPLRPLKRKIPSMRPQQFPGKRKPKPGPFLPRAEERLKDPGDHLRGNPRPFIRDPDDVPLRLT